MRTRTRSSAGYLCAQYARKQARTLSGQAIAEFGVALMLIIPIFLLFLYVMLVFGTFAVFFMSCNYAARQCAPAFTGSAAVAAKKAALTSGFFTTINSLPTITQAGSSTDAGYDLTVYEGGNSGILKNLGTPPVAVATPIPSGTFYLYKVKTKQKLSPFFVLPFLGPAQATSVNFQSTCFVEHPEGLGQ